MPSNDPDDLDAFRPPIEDPRTRFYLDNWETIEAWARLRDEAAPHIADGFAQLLDLLSKDGSARDGDVEVSPDGDAGIAIDRLAWRNGTDSGPFWVSLYWNPKIFKAGQLEVYVGIWKHDHEPWTPRQDAALRTTCVALRNELGSADWHASPRWQMPLWRRVGPAGEPLDERRLYDLARRQLWACWDAAAPHLDAIIAMHASG